MCDKLNFSPESSVCLFWLGDHGNWTVGLHSYPCENVLFPLVYLFFILHVFMVLPTIGPVYPQCAFLVQYCHVLMFSEWVPWTESKVPMTQSNTREPSRMSLYEYGRLCKYIPHHPSCMNAWFSFLLIESPWYVQVLQSPNVKGNWSRKDSV